MTFIRNFRCFSEYLIKIHGLECTLHTVLHIVPMGMRIKYKLIYV